MRTSDYVGLLAKWATELAGDLTDDQIHVLFTQEIKSNYPWLYLEFQFAPNLDRWTLNHLERALDAFTKSYGGSYDDFRVFPADGVLTIRFKLVYTEKP